MLSTGLSTEPTHQSVGLASNVPQVGVSLTGTSEKAGSKVTQTAFPLP